MNWETPHASPLALTPDGQTLLSVNTADNRLEVFELDDFSMVHVASIPVGLRPVSVRARTNDEAWVVSHISDSVNIVDLSQEAVVRSLRTADEPCDVVFAGSNLRAFVSCSQANAVQVFDLANLSAAPVSISIDAEDPRALAVSPDGLTVYAAIFESGNGSTILGGGSLINGGFPPNVVNDNVGPYNGTNPPPNDGNQFDPPIKPNLPPPPAVGMIVKRDANDRWMDDNGGDWTSLVSGPQAANSGRPVGWTLPDHDVAIIDADTLAVTYENHLMNINMAIATHPMSGDVMVVGTDGTNEIRFEPVLNGKFLRVLSGRTGPLGAGAPSVQDLNPHLDYSVSTISQASRDLSLGDPRGIAWNATGSRGYVTGMGSNNVLVIDAQGSRMTSSTPIEVGEGPTGVVFDDLRNRVYVLNKFEASISVIDSALELETARVYFFDPTPSAIRMGRKHLYDTHKNSGLGQIACGSCHVDSRMDRLAWDLGSPEGDMKSVLGQNLGANVPGLSGGFEDFHPMKGPMTTQTLQDIIGKEPLHWRGDRDGIEEFNGAFVGLQGDDIMLSDAEMQEFEDFLATIHFPPNPFRNMDNTLPSSMDMQGHFSPGRFSPKGTPLPTADATRGLALFRPPNTLDVVPCSTCHTLPTGLGTDFTLVGTSFVPFPEGPNGEHHHALISLDGSTNVSIKIPQLRNMHEKVGFDTSQTSNRAGFGFLHDGSVDSLAQFVAEPLFSVSSDQDIADLVAFMLAFPGSDLPYGAGILEPPATSGLDTHAGVGTQTTLVDSANPDPGQLALLNQMINLANVNSVGFVIKGVQGGLVRGYTYVGAGTFQSDRLAETLTQAQMLAAASPGSELTATLVVSGTQQRVGIDRDEDGFFDRDELDAGSDPADPGSIPGCGSILTFGTPEINLTGDVVKIDAVGGGPTVGNPSFAINLSDGNPSSFCVLFSGDSEGYNVTPWGIIRVGGPNFTRTYSFTDAAGGTAINIPITPAMAGTTRYFQYAVRAPNLVTMDHVLASAGLRVTFCP